MQNLSILPLDKPSVFLVRHAERTEIPPGAPGNDVPLTEAGRQSSLELGRSIGKHLKSVHSSPVLRCMDTAKLLAQGAERSISIQPNQLLGGPGAFVLDGNLAWQNWERFGHERMISIIEMPLIS